MRFIAENWGTIVVLVLVTAAVACVIKKMIKDRKSGCGCGCEGCSNAASCRK